MELKQTILGRIKQRFMGNKSTMTTTTTHTTDTDVMPEVTVQNVQMTQTTLPSKNSQNGLPSANKKQNKLRNRKAKPIRLDPMSKWTEEEKKVYRHLKYLQKKRAFKEQGLTARGEVPVRSQKNVEGKPKRVKMDIDYRWYWSNFICKNRTGCWQKRYNKLYSEAIETGRRYGDFVARSHRCIEKYGTPEQKQLFQRLLNDMMTDLQK